MSPQFIDRNRVREIWQDVLRVPDIGWDDNFFELGGHSISAAKIVSRLVKNLNIKASVSDIFNFPTLNKFSHEIEKVQAEAGNSLTLKKCDRSVLHPLSLAQKRLWFLYKLRPDIPLYSIPLFSKISGYLDTNALRLALNFLVQRHEGLRTKVKTVGGHSYQEILPDTTEFPFEEEWVQNDHLLHPAHELSLQPNGQLLSHFRSKIEFFNLEEDILCRCLLLHISDKEKLLCLVFHHLIFDDWSLDVFARELSLAYAALKMGQKVELEALPFQYVDFSVSQDYQLSAHALEKRLAQWKKKLQGISPLPLPNDFPRPELLDYKGRVLTRRISAESMAAIKALSNEKNVSLFILLLTCFKWALSLFAESEDIVVGSPVSNRPLSDQRDVIGYFVNTLVFRTVISKNDSFLQSLEKVKMTVLEGYDLQEVPFEKIVNEMNVARELNKNPLFQVMFSIAYEAEIATIKLDGAEVEPAYIQLPLSKFDMSLHAIVRGSSIEFVLEYLSELFKTESIEGVFDDFLSILEKIPASPEITLSQIFEQAANNTRDRASPSKPRFGTNSESVLKDGDSALYQTSKISIENRSKKDLKLLEDELLTIWKQLLKKEEIDSDSNFFDLGGNSFLVVQMQDLIQRHLKITISVIDIFQFASIKKLARLCCNQKTILAPTKIERDRREKFLNSLQHYSHRSS